VLDKIKSVYTKMHFADLNFDLTYSLADILILGKNTYYEDPESFEMEISLTREDIDHLIKAKSALSEVDNMIISIDKDPDREPICKFSFGDEHGHNTQITYNMYGDINVQEMKLPFNSNLFKTILQANKDMTEGTMHLSSKGLMKLKFKTENGIKSEYYMVRKESTNF
jgi:hypothetical protein